MCGNEKRNVRVCCWRAAVSFSASRVRAAALHNYCGSDQSLIITHIPSHMESRRDWNQLVNRRGLIASKVFALISA
jgi:hypothetical protein